jgi:RND family efflux transporter MFP subunit
MNKTSMWTLCAVALGTVALAGCGERSEHEARASAPLVPQNTVTVAAVPLVATVPVDGTVQARRRAEISTRMMARVSEVSVDLGSQVRQGQVLIRLGTEDIEASRAKAEAAEAAASASNEEAARQAARMDTLLAADAVARVQRDQAYLALAQSESQLTVARATLREVETAASYARVVAPFDGVVVARSVDPGALAAPGMPLLVLEASGGKEAIIAVAPEAAAGLAPAAVLAVATRDGRTADGRVRVIAGGADPMTRTVEVRIDVPADWPSGSSVTAQVPVGERQAVMIPVEYVVRRGQLTGVQVVQGDAQILRWVRLGRTVGASVEVLSGLGPGEVIAR